MAWGDSFDTTAPNFTPVNHPKTPASVWGTITAPYPTNTWFNNLFLDTTTNRIATIPYQEKAISTGLYICYPTYNNIAGNVTSAFLQNVSLECTETPATKKITAFDKASATEKWTVDGTHYMTAPLVKGMPYVTMIYTALTPIIKTQHAILSVNGGSSPTGVTATKFKVVLNNGQTWIFYASSSITLTWSNTGGWQMLASATFTGTIRAVILTDSGQETLLDTYAAKYPTGVSLAVTFNGDLATMTYTWSTGGSGSLLMLALPHHLDMFPTPPTEPGVTFSSLKGTCTGIEGTSWVLQESLTTIQWDAPSAPASDKQADIISALNSEDISAPTTPDPYGFGKAVARLGRLALIADYFSLTSKATAIRTNMKTAINAWLDHSNTDALEYDQLWGGICSTNGLADSGADYGQGYYNDHHFHYGYFLYAAACIAKTDSTWLSSYNDKVRDLARDIANPSASDTYFTQFRNKDFFDFHSWSNGINESGDVNNQESSSESINAYYGLYLWGLASGDTNIRDTGRLLLAMELRAVKKYYHIKGGDSIYGAPFNANKVVGILWATKVDYQTFFGANVEYIHGIQIIPVTPITELSLTADWVEEEYPILAAASNPTDPWKGFMIADHAVIAPDAAWADALALSSYDNGNSKTNLLYWIATRPESTPVAVINTQYITDFYQVKDNAKTTIPINSLNNTTNPITISLTSGQGAHFPDTTGANPYLVTVYDDTNYPDPGDDPRMEKMSVVRTVDSVTLTRGQLGTNVVAHPGTPTMRLLVMAKHFQMIHDAVNTIEEASTLNGVPTEFAFNSGVLQKKDPLSSTWSNFVIKGINYTPTPIGYNPDAGRIWDPFCNTQQAKWFASHFKDAGGTACRMYWPGNGQVSTAFSPAVPSGLPDTNQILRTLDIFYQYGIYVLIDVFVRFYPAYGNSQIREWYKNSVAQHFVQAVSLTKQHPAIMGYVFGNETNLIKNGDHQNLGGLLTIGEWWDFANDVAYEGKQIDSTHIMGISSGLSNPDSITEAIAGEESGQLENFDFHGVNIYRGNDWKQPSNGVSFWSQWVPRNNKPAIILETGQDSYDTTNGVQDEASQASTTVNLWTTFDRTKCPGVFFFSSFDEQWKAGEDGGTPVTNDGKYASSYYYGNNDGFYILPDLKGNEEHFGWWRYITATPYANPPVAKKVVATMKATW